MKSRLDKYDNKESFSRVNKNQNLYDDIYSNTNYSNMVVIDDSNEIDISKIKEIIDKQKNVNKRVDKTPNLEKEYDSIVPPKNYENKLYDINEVLKEAKSQRDIMEDANEKRKIQNVLGCVIYTKINLNFVIIKIVLEMVFLLETGKYSFVTFLDFFIRDYFHFFWNCRVH